MNDVVAEAVVPPGFVDFGIKVPKSAGKSGAGAPGGPESINDEAF